MSEEERILNEFKALVEKETSQCSQAGWPNICELNTSDQGKRLLLEKVFRMVSEERLEISTAVAHVEVMLDEERTRNNAD